MYRGMYGRKLRNVFVAIACCFAVFFSLLFSLVMMSIQRSSYQSTLQYATASKSDSFRFTTSTILSALTTLQKSEASKNWGESKNRSEYYLFGTTLFQQVTRAITNVSYVNYDLYITQNNNESYVINYQGTISKDAFFTSDNNLTPEDWRYISAHFSTNNSPLFFPVYQEKAFVALYYVVRQETEAESLLYFVKIPAATLCGTDPEQRYIIYNDGVPVAYSTLSSPVLDNLEKTISSYKMLASTNLSAYSHFSHRNSEIFIINSSHIPLTIAYQYSFSLFLTPQVLLLSILVILVFCALSFFVFLKISNRIYRPLHDAVFEKPLLSVRKEPFDELGIIRQNADTVTSLNEQLEMAIKENSTISTRRYYRELLFGIPDLDCPLSADQMFAKYCVALIELQVKNHDSDSTDWMLHLQKNLIYIHAQNLFVEHNIYCFSEGYNTCAILLQCDSDKEAYNILSGFFSIPELQLELKVALSDVREQAIHIYDCYQQALHILEYRYKIPANSIITREDIQESSANAYYYPLVLENRIIQTLALGNPSCIELYDGIIQENIQKLGLTSDAYKNLIFSLIGTLIRVFQELKTTPRELLGYDIDFQEFYREWDHSKATDRIRVHIKNIVISVQQKANNKDDEILHNMLNYITQNYFHDIMLIDIAEQFDITPTYCSTLFKRLSKDNFKTFLNRYRIERACETLHNDPDTKIRDLSIRVGFNSSNTFIRAFSKVTGITPKAYAEKIALEQKALGQKP